MINPNKFLKFLHNKGISFFTGVPDSILKNFSFKIDNYSKYKHIISANEGNSISIATGYNLATKKIAAVYLQNSGLGNAINPLASLSHKDVYSIPMLLIIGWRGYPKFKDEPQHLVKGKITTQLLNLLKIKYCILSSEKDFNKLSKLIRLSKRSNNPVACLIKKNTFSKVIKKNPIPLKALLRSDVLEKLLRKIKKNSLLISTTGYTSRELHQLRKLKKIKNGKDFYMVGSMGHVSSLTLGISLFSKKETICIDGDGSVLMHLGSLVTAGNLGNKNFKHILLNNFSHESVGGQKTLAKKIDFKNLVKSIGYKKYFFSDNKKNFDFKLKKFLKSSGPSFFEIRVLNKSMKNLERPKDLKLIKKHFIK